MTIREMLVLADELEAFARGRFVGVDIERVLRQLDASGQINVRENVHRFRNSIKQRRLVAGITPEGTMLRAAQGVRDAIGNFVARGAADE